MSSRREELMFFISFIVLLFSSTVFQVTTSDQVLPTTTTNSFSETFNSDQYISENVFPDFNNSEDLDEAPVPLEGLTFPLKNGLGPICRFNETDPLCDKTTTRVFSSRYR